MFILLFNCLQNCTLQQYDTNVKQKINKHVLTLHIQEEAFGLFGFYSQPSKIVTNIQY